MERKFACLLNLGSIQLLSYEAMTWALSDVKNVDILDGKPSGKYVKYIKNVREKKRKYLYLRLTWAMKDIIGN